MSHLYQHSSPEITWKPVNSKKVDHIKMVICSACGCVREYTNVGMHVMHHQMYAYEGMIVIFANHSDMIMDYLCVKCGKYVSSGKQSMHYEECSVVNKISALITGFGWHPEIDSRSSLVLLDVTLLANILKLQSGKPIETLDY
jgi:hypothetical protein